MYIKSYTLLSLLAVCSIISICDPSEISYFAFVNRFTGRTISYILKNDTKPYHRRILEKSILSDIYAIEDILWRIFFISDMGHVRSCPFTIYIYRYVLDISTMGLFIYKLKTNNGIVLLYNNNNPSDNNKRHRQAARSFLLERLLCTVCSLVSPSGFRVHFFLFLFIILSGCEDSHLIKNINNLKNCFTRQKCVYDI